MRSGILQAWPRCLLFGFLALALAGGGCAKRGGYDTADVTGKVLFKGKPLPGGQVTFVAVQGGTATTGTIDENGSYSVKAPVGDVRIAVDNRMLRKTASKGPMLKRPDAEGPSTLKGEYVHYNEKYYGPDTSGLTFKVEKGTNTHDINLD
jgi:hypothetical protein